VRELRLRAPKTPGALVRGLRPRAPISFGRHLAVAGDPGVLGVRRRSLRTGVRARRARTGRAQVTLRVHHIKATRISSVDADIRLVVI
jgi:hypothetical protein